MTSLASIRVPLASPSRRWFGGAAVQRVQRRKPNPQKRGYSRSIRAGTRSAQSGLVPKPGENRLIRACAEGTCGRIMTRRRGRVDPRVRGGGTCRQPDWPAAPTVDPCVRGWHFLTAERFSAMRGQSAGMRGHLTDLACRPFGPGSIRVRAEGTSPRRPGQERWVDPRVTRRALQHDAGQRLPHGSIRAYAEGTACRSR